jgi:hypothetical protein
MLSALVVVNKDKINNLTAIAILGMDMCKNIHDCNINGTDANCYFASLLLLLGLSLELVVMDVPSGVSVCRVSRTPKVSFPTSADSFTTDIASLLELVWAGKKLMIDTESCLKKRKRVALGFNSITANKFTLQPSLNLL